MKRTLSGTWLALLLMICTVFFIVNCSSGGTEEPVDGGGTTTLPTTPATVAAIQVSSSSATIGTNQTATITVTLYNPSGRLVNEIAEVVFSLDNPLLGSILSPVTTASGFVSQVFTARDAEGSVTITATASGVSGTTTIQISNATSAANVAVAANPSSITIGGTSVVSATVTDSLGSPMPNGTTVNFSVNNTSLGTIVGSATISGGLGVAQSTFSASSTTAGTATITATSGSASGTGTITINAPAAGSIEFSSATPQVVVIKGAGGQETSEVMFLVKDASGNPIGWSETVQMVLSGPNGGEYLGSTAGTTTLDVGTVAGYATVVLHSGTIPGTATISATVLSNSLSTSSGIIAIGGGVPSADHFSLSAEKLNIEGLAYDNITDDILALLADRYGNYNILEGTAVSFYSECGGIDRAIAVDATGAGTVTFRTQNPHPLDIVPDPLGTPAGSGTCGSVCDEENAFISLFNLYFGVDITAGANNPRDGHCTIIAVVDGEEEFTDVNASGLYDVGEPYVDTYDDIHLDKDDDPINIPFGTEVPGMPYDSASEDLVVDRNENGVFNGMNNVWDNVKRISKRINLLYTGTPSITFSTGSLNVANGSSQTIYYAVHDVNYNQPIGGTKVTAAYTGAAGAATLTGTKSWTFLDSNDLGTMIFELTLSDADATTTVLKAAEITFTVTWRGDPYVFSLSGFTN